MKNIDLPSNIDYTKYFSIDGMKSKEFGKPLWKGFFILILGRYPVIIDESNPEHIKIKNAFRQLFESLEILMPCVFCRNSFAGFLQQIPLEPHLIGRIELFYWLYSIKDLVNKKLIKQEVQCYKDEKNKYRNLYYSKKVSLDKCIKHLQEYKQSAFKTIPTPPFETVLEYFEQYRAKCVVKLQKCI